MKLALKTHPHFIPPRDPISLMVVPFITPLTKIKDIMVVTKYLLVGFISSSTFFEKSQKKLEGEAMMATLTAALGGQP